MSYYVSTSDQRRLLLTDAQVDAFRSSLRGELITRGDPAFEDTRQVWNGLIDRRPAMIVRCTGPADVIASVNLARTHNLLLAVRGGGHSVAGSALCEGGLVIDLSQMRAVQVDPVRRLARAAGGATLGDLDHETQAFGLAAPVGVVSRTGVAGLTLGGGFGWLTRKYGLALDNLESVEMVTADGQLRTASGEQNADLFWGVRGGGGNFGVVTSFEYRLHPVGPMVTMAAPFYPAALAADGLRFFREYMSRAPDELFAIAVMGTFPDEAPFPAHVRGKPSLAFVAVHSGPVEEGHRVVQPLRTFDTPTVDLTAPLLWVRAQRFFDADYPDGMLYYWKSIYLDRFTDRAIDTLAEHTASQPSPASTLDVWYLGGAFARAGSEETAFGPRDAEVMVGLEANWTQADRSQANIEWTRKMHARLKPFSSGGAYINFSGSAEESKEAVRDVYGRSYERLAALKAKYDPGNLFRVNHNIVPAAG
jgi:FAD/FMN-containing dehydrogenase